MRVIGEQETLPAPHVCFICETSPQREAGVLVVDSGFSFNPHVVHPLKGAKLICERCVQEAANLLGYRDGDEVDAARKAIDDARAYLQPLQNTIQSLAEDLSGRVDHLFNLPDIEGTKTSKVVLDKREADKEDESAGA